MFEGNSEKIEQTAAVKKVPTGAINWSVTSATLADGRTALLNLPEGYIDHIAKGIKPIACRSNLNQVGRRSHHWLSGRTAYIRFFCAPDASFQIQGGERPTE